jgi:hypothetical protein
VDSARLTAWRTSDLGVLHVSYLEAVTQSIATVLVCYTRSLAFMCPSMQGASMQLSKNAVGSEVGALESLAAACRSAVGGSAGLMIRLDDVTSMCLNLEYAKNRLA